MSKKLFKDLKAAMEDVVAHQRGELELESRTFIIPEPPAEYKPRQIKKIREVNHYTQSTFAKVLNVSVKTVQSWESGLRVPSHAALRLLEIVDKGIYNPPIIHRGRK
jgi:putative transcriptional regulator